jgi:hypothetical protein
MFSMELKESTTRGSLEVVSLIYLWTVHAQSGLCVLENIYLFFTFLH